MQYHRSLFWVHFYSVFSLMTHPYIYLIPKLYVILLQTITRFTHVEQMWNQFSVVFKTV